jgi:hypothetical protein
MFARTDIRTLNRIEVEQFVKFRLLMRRATRACSRRHLRLIAELSQGIPRVIKRVATCRCGWRRARDDQRHAQLIGGMHKRAGSERCAGQRNLRKTTQRAAAAAARANATIVGAGRRVEAREPEDFFALVTDEAADTDTELRWAAAA